MIKTQHCPNCEATEQSLSDFRQEVSDAVRDYYGGEYVPASSRFAKFIIPAPKPDPLINVAKMLGYYNTAAKHLAGDIRAALDAAGFEIREKG